MSKSLRVIERGKRWNVEGTLPDGHTIIVAKFIGADYALAALPRLQAEFDEALELHKATDGISKAIKKRLKEAFNGAS
jgi:hypothetical protein